MQKVVRVLACCAVLAGCAGAEAEVAMKAVDFSKPVPPRIFFVECGPLEGITMYPVPLPGKYTVEGKYRLSSSVSDLSVVDDSVKYPGFDRVVIAIPDDQESGVNANFFVQGLANGCIGVFAATRVDILPPEEILSEPSEHGITHSSVVDDVYLAFAKDPKTKDALDRNALFINASMYVEPRSDGGLVASVTSFLLFEGNAYATRVAR
ncbi:MAG: hypothetical protein INF46_05370 [Rhodobacter sp.]|nr:hypothetical protein [Rhodobacter sp.]MCA3525446.1 hypothetical protein [Rhodobacter sp.]MCA3543190.1 hypothetical protein [Rhodobacter sp.]